MSEKEIRVTVCQLRSDPDGMQRDWEALVEHMRREGSDLVLLPEMPFYPWPFWRQTFLPEVWQATVAAHDRWQERVAELAPAIVTGSRPAGREGRRLNRGFVWQEGDERLRLFHSKAHLPDESGFWEASWYQNGRGAFRVVELDESGRLCAGFLICTELWFMDHARTYGQEGAHLLLTPRATERRTVDKWLAGGRAAAVIAGAYSLSSNHYGDYHQPVSLGGLGWIIGPDGEVLALTTPSRPCATMTIDLGRAERAKETFPRYVPD